MLVVGAARLVARGLVAGPTAVLVLVVGAVVLGGAGLVLHSGDLGWSAPTVEKAWWSIVHGLGVFLDEWDGLPSGLVLVRRSFAAPTGVTSSERRELVFVRVMVKSGMSGIKERTTNRCYHVRIRISATPSWGRVQREEAWGVVQHVSLVDTIELGL